MAILQVYRHMADAPPIAGGCPILNTAIDSDDVHPALRDRARQAMDNWRQLIHRIVEKGKQRGELRPDLDPEEASTVIIATIEGAVMLSKTLWRYHLYGAHLEASPSLCADPTRPTCLMGSEQANFFCSQKDRSVFSVSRCLTHTPVVSAYTAFADSFITCSLAPC
jgi:hypothetical protein